MRAMKLSVVAATVMLASACSTLPEYVTNATPEKAVEQRLSNDFSKYQIAHLADVAESEQWWQQVENQELNQLIATVLEQNQNLKASAARLRAAVAQLSAEQKSRWPQGSISVNANRDKGVTTATSEIFESTSAGAALTWQLDLSGRLNALAEAANAAAENRQGIHQSLVAELVSNSVRSYLYWQSLQQQKMLTQNQLTALEDSIEILDVRYAEGLSTDLELNRTKAQYFELKQRLPQIAGELARVSSVLAVLQNKAVAKVQLTPLTSEQYQALNFDIQLASPLDALVHRGDLRSAVALLAQQNELTVSAERALYPDISFSAFAGVFNNQGISFSDTQSSWQIAPQLSWSLFSYPQLLAQLDTQQALSEASYYDYQNTVSQIVADTEVALQLLVQNEAQLDFAKRRSYAASKAYEIANSGYQEGQIGYLELLNARQDVLIAEQAQLVAHNLWLEANVNVYGEFSGDWSSALLSSTTELSAALGK